MRASDQDAPTTELVAGSVGDRCPNCDSSLASDQRYCVNCGERRGRPRFSLTELAAAAPPPPPPPESRWRASGGGHPGLTLVAGVATLLIALGVGVLIGQDANKSTPARSPAPIIVNGGTGSSASPTGTASTSASGGTNRAAASSSAARAARKGAVPKVTLNKKTIQAASNAAARVMGSNGNLTPNVTQKQGGACTGGAGCQGGHFTGNFFK